jgi:hypothetical protein
MGRRKGGDVRIDIYDTGIGMAPNICQGSSRLFSTSIQHTPTSSASASSSSGGLSRHSVIASR